MSERLIALGLQLEQELDRAIATFAADNAGLIREACQVGPEHADLGPVVLTTMFGHVLSRMRKLRGHGATLGLAETLLEQLEQAEQRAAALKGPKESVH